MTSQHRLKHPMTTVISFDPGGRTGWSVFRVVSSALTDKHIKILSNIHSHHFGEFVGEEHDQVVAALDLCTRSSSDCNLYVVTEDFTLMQMTGGRELLSPVRINAALDFALKYTAGIALHYQPRSTRAGVTKARLQRWRIGPVTGKDAFSAVQHGVVFMRRLKAGHVQD